LIERSRKWRKLWERRVALKM